jgi:hypothetical protein
MFLKNSLPLVFLLFLLFFQASATASAIGASPGTISFSKMLRDGYAETYITVSNPSGENIGVSMGADGDIKNWLSFDPNTTTLGVGGSIRVKVIAKPPSYQPNGNYNGTIFVVSQPPSTQLGGSGSVTVAVIGILTNIEVTDVQIENFKVEGVNVPKTEECRDIGVFTWITNIGNVKTTPKIHIDIYDQQESTLLKSFDQSDTEILPTITKLIVSKISPELAQYKCIPPGLYKVKIKAYKGNELNFQGSYILEIVPRGTLTVKGELISLTAKSTATMGEIVKVTGVFRNTGEVPVDAKLKVESYLVGALTQVAEGDTLEVFPGENKELTAYVTPILFGKYTMRGSVLYSGKITDTKDASVDVSPNILIYVVILIVIIVVVFFVWRKKEKRPKRLKRR